MYHFPWNGRELQELEGGFFNIFFFLHSVTTLQTATLQFLWEAKGVDIGTIALKCPV